MTKDFWIPIIILPFALILTACSGGKSEFKVPHIPSIYGNNIHKVIAFDKDTIHLIGSFGLSARTTRGSEIKHENSTKDFWEFQKTGLEEDLLCDASFPDPEYGWAVGIKGNILHTKDGGKTWSLQESGTGNHLFTVCFVDRQNGWAAGYLDTILHTDDGGENWEEQEEEDPSEKDFFTTNPNFNGLYFHDANEGWLVGEFGTVYHTEDGGQNWIYVPTPELKPVVEEDEWEMPRFSLFDVYFADRNRGYILGIEGVMLRTEDGGKNWNKVNTSTSQALFSISVVGNKCWAVGSRGGFIVSTDGGKSWTSKSGAIHTKGFLSSVTFIDNKTGWVVGKSGAVFKTIDGGETWDWLSGVSYDWPEFKAPKALVGE